MRTNGDSFLEGILELKIIKIPEQLNGLNSFKFSKSIFLAYEAIMDRECIFGRSNTDFADCYFDDGTNNMSFHFSNGFNNFDSIQLNLFQFNDATYQLLLKMDEKAFNEDYYGAANHLISPIQVPENVEGASGFVGGAISEKYLFY